MRKLLTGLLFITCIASWTGLSSAQERPYQAPLPSTQLSIVNESPSASNRAPVREYAPSPPGGGGLSEFERYIRGRVDITKSQLEVLKEYRNIYFSRRPDPIPNGMVVVPVRIITPGEESKDAGFLIGPPDQLQDVFNLLGIKSTFNVPTDINQFGYEFFTGPSAAFVAQENVPVGPDYVIGPDDEIRVTVWGKVEGRWNVVVDRDGSITLPKLGVIGVAGLTFEELRSLLNREFGKYYTSFEMNVSMGALRTITVYVVGNARRPGSYTMSSLSTIVNALLASGGPDKTGTMRDIQLKRGGNTIAHLDLYDLFLKGDKTGDMRLMSEDVIFIPPVGALAAVTGSVNRPAVYELAGEASILELIEMAGGFSDIAFRGRIQIERITDNARQIVFESSTAEAGEAVVMAGDVVRIFPYVEDRKVVKVSGAVQRADEYGYREGMTVKDLLELSGGLKYYAFREEAELTRVTVTADGPVTERIIVNIADALAGKAESNIPLKENDYLFVRPVPEWNLYQTVSISGEVMFPGTYTIRKGEKLSSLIQRAGGFTQDAYLRGAVFVREDVRRLQQQRLDEMIERLERDLFGIAAAQTAAATSPEEARIEEFQTEQKRNFVSKLKTIRAKGRMAVRLERPKELEGSPFNIELEDGDSLSIPKNPRSVQVIGSVYNQMAFIFDAERDLGDYIQLAGGYTENADKKRVYVLKADGTAERARDGGISWSESSNRWEWGGLRPESGDTVVVPEKLDKVAWLRETKDITQILYQIAVTAGVLIVAF